MLISVSTEYKTKATLLGQICGTNRESLLQGYEKSQQLFMRNCLLGTEVIVCRPLQGVFLLDENKFTNKKVLRFKAPK
jgi:hypothetical protein